MDNMLRMVAYRIVTECLPMSATAEEVEAAVADAAEGIRAYADDCIIIALERAAYDLRIKRTVDPARVELASPPCHGDIFPLDDGPERKS